MPTATGGSSRSRCWERSCAAPSRAGRAARTSTGRRTLPTGRSSGRIQLRAEYDWSHVGDYPYVDATTGLPLAPFDNSRDGGYLEASYRPTKVEALKNWEVILRRDWLDLPKDPTGTLGFFDERR